MNADQTPREAQPVMLDKVDGSGTYYGVKIADVGEDCESVLAFTHDARRAIAATRAHIRQNHGEIADSIDMRKSLFVQVFDHCGCPPHGNCVDCECERYGLPPCSPDTYAWMTEVCTPDAEHAIPVIELDWTC